MSRRQGKEQHTHPDALVHVLVIREQFHFRALGQGFLLKKIIVDGSFVSLVGGDVLHQGGMVTDFVDVHGNVLARGVVGFAGGIGEIQDLLVTA